MWTTRRIPELTAHLDPEVEDVSLLQGELQLVAVTLLLTDHLRIRRVWKRCSRQAGWVFMCFTSHVAHSFLVEIERREREKHERTNAMTEDFQREHFGGE